MTKTLANTLIMEAIWPPCVILANIPKIWTGNKGMMIELMTLTTISLNSSITFSKASPLMDAIPKPIVKATSKAVITPMTAGISIVKYGESKASSGLAKLWLV